MNINKKIKKEVLSKEELERLEILQEAESVKGEQLLIDLNSELIAENEAEKLIGLKIDDPIEKYQLYYK